MTTVAALALYIAGQTAWLLTLALGLAIVFGVADSGVRRLVAHFRGQ